MSRLVLVGEVLEVLEAGSVRASTHLSVVGVVGHCEEVVLRRRLVGRM